MENFETNLKKIPGSLYTLKTKKDPVKGTLEPDNDIAKLFKLLCEEFEELKKVVDQLSLIRDIDSQKGDVLDEIGRIVRESRKGRTDEDYRVFLKIAINRNNATGSLEPVAGLTKAIAGDLDYHIEEHFYDGGMLYLDASRYFDGETLLNPNSDAAEPAAFEVQIEGSLDALKVPEHLGAVIDDIRSGGVKAAIKPFWKAMTCPLLKHCLTLNVNYQSKTADVYSFLDGQSAFDGTKLMNGFTGQHLTHTMEFEERNN